MSRFGLLLALLSLLFVSSTAELSLNASASLSLGATSGPQWRRVTAAAPWSPRAGGVVEWYKGSVRTYNPDQPNQAARTLQGPVMLMYGTGVWSFSDNPEDRVDVWASTNGVRWQQVIVDGDGFEGLLSAITVQDSQGRQFRIQGAISQPPNNGVYGDVYMSTNGGQRWTLQGQLPNDEGRFLGQAVVDSRDYIYVTMGQYAGGALNDIWVSSNQGRVWRPVNANPNALPPPRAVHGSVVTKFRDGTDAMYIMYGWLRGSGQPGIGNVYTNDVWVSTTAGTRWTQILAHAPWAARGDCQVEVTDAGVIIIAGGVSSASGEDKRELNDVWASLDGGYSWGQCTDNAEFSDRQFPYTLLDGAGYLYVMGGREEQNGGRQVNDVWRSEFSYNDVDEVARRCNLFVPSCGVGLKCLPNEDETFMQGGWGVSCAACPYTASATTATTPAANNLMTILFVVFMLLFLVVTALLVYTYYRMRQSGVTSPIPLPAGAQRWWNGNAQAGVLGEGLNKGTTDSADSYNQLSIRDQM